MRPSKKDRKIPTTIYWDNKKEKLYYIQYYGINFMYHFESFLRFHKMTNELGLEEFVSLILSNPEVFDSKFEWIL